MDFERLKEIIEDNENDKFGFIYTVEEFLKNMDLSIEAPPTIDSVGKLSKKSDEGNDRVSNKKIKELQRTNELLLGELRKANEKYLNERLVQKQLKSELDSLEQELEKLKINNLRLEVESIRPPPSQKILSPDRSRQSTSPSGASLKKNFLEIQKENMSLKTKIYSLETEVKSLTYYREKILQQSSKGFSLMNDDPVVREMQNENESQKNKIESIGITIQKFLLVMKKLQRSIHNKDPNASQIKLEFEA